MKKGRIFDEKVNEIRVSEIRVSEIRVIEIRVSEIRVSEIRVSEIRVSEIRVIEIKGNEIRISSNHHELHGAIFVSSFKDKEFMKEHVQQYLERNLGYMLCFHERDFVVGESIPANMEVAINHSRRMIMIISRFVVSLFSCEQIRSCFQ